MVKSAPLWLNALLFQANWFVCVFARIHWLLISTIILLIVHGFIFVKVKQEWGLILTFALTGFLLDSIIAYLGLVMFNPLESITIGKITLAPLWLLGLWLSFSTCLCHCLKIFQQRQRLLCIITVFAIPLNYFIGAKLTQTTFSEPAILPLGLITLYWLVLLILGVMYAKRISPF
jgi:hypothetical protein